MSASEELRKAAADALRTIPGMAVHDLAPVQAAFPHAVIEAGPETDWGHKSGAGREVRIAVSISDKGERPVRLRALAEQSEGVVGAMSGLVGTWQLVTMHFHRSRMVRDRSQNWVAVIEFRARMLAPPSG